MRVLVDVTHPAHVHLFRNAIEQFRTDGHAVCVAAREKDVTTDLLDAYEVPHTVLSSKRSGPAGVPREWLLRELRLLRLARSFGPDVLLSRLNPATAHVARALGVPNVVFHDSEPSGAIDRITTPFATVICTPAEFARDLGPIQERYEGFHELAYLHPARFSRDPSPLRTAGVDPDEPYAVVRLVGMDAHHDVGADGLSAATVRSLVDELGDRGEVYISSEKPLPDDLADNGLPVPPEAMHQLLAFADLYVGDSGTMPIEAGVLGTPSIRYDPLGVEMGNFTELEAYGLVVSTDDEDELLERTRDVASDDDAAARWRRRRRRMLGEKIDVTAYMTELVAEVAEGGFDGSTGGEEFVGSTEGDEFAESPSDVPGEGPER